MTTTMNIASVKLINSGKKGLLVIYSSPSSCKGATSMDALKHARKFPIHWELESAFKDLRSVLLDVCDYSKETREKDIQDTTVNEVSYNGSSFSLKGVKTILDTDKEIPLNPKDITSDDYSEFDAAKEILDTIYKETKAYMAGEKEISDEQLILRFNEGNAEFDNDSFANMTPEEKRDEATRVLHEMGHIVIHTDEIVPVEFEEEEEKEKDEFEVLVEEDVVDDNFELEPAGEKVSDTIQPTMEVVKDTKKTSSKKSVLSLVDGPGDSFKIVAAEPQQSTARKIAKG